MARALIIALIAVAALSCSADSNTSSHDGGSAVEPEVQIGTDNPDTLDFIPLKKGGDIPLQTFGQGGTHAALAVRCIGFGNTAFVDVDVINQDSGDSVMSVKMTRPALLLCRDDEKRVCDDLPLNVMTGGLADPDKKDGLHVRVVATVRNPAGVMASAMQDGVLRKAFDGPLPAR